MFTEAQLVSFGNFLLKTYGVQVYSTDGNSTPLFQREVTDADFANWKHEKPNDQILPSPYQIGQPVWLRLWSKDLICEVYAVHFYNNKIKYDLKVIAENGETTRLYNVDSDFVIDKIAEKADKVS